MAQWKLDLKMNDIPGTSHASKEMTMSKLGKKMQKITKRQNKFQQLIDENQIDANSEDDADGLNKNVLRSEFIALTTIIEEVRVELIRLETWMSEIEQAIDNLSNIADPTV